MAIFESAMRLRIFFRVFLGFSVVILLSLTAFFLFSLRVSRASSREGLEKGLERTAETAAAALLTGAAAGREAELNALTSGMGRRAQARITVVSPDGTVLADSEQEPARMENHASRPEIAAAMSGVTGVSVRFSSTLGRDMLYVAVPMILPDGRTAVVRASAPRSELEAAGTVFARSTLLFASILLAVSLLAALLIARSILTPLGQLSHTVGRFAGGDFSARIHLRGADEVARLASRFNDMGEKVQALFNEVSRRTRELDGIFSSVTQGIALLDGGSCIVRANRAFAEIVGAVDVQGMKIWEAVKTAGLVEYVERARRGALPTEEIEIGDRRFLCTAAAMGEGAGLILVLQDISGPERLEKLKRDFVTNASHELRTPLTAIKGFVELLEGELSGEAARRLAAIERNVERMTAIVEDLLRLSRLEGGEPDFSPAELDLGRLVRETAEGFGRRAQEKGLSLSVNTPPEPLRIRADGFQLERMLVNLVDNAVKYTERGEIRVELFGDAGAARIEVTDTGIGIPKEYIPRIFERFFVVDKSRSRALGGTGLGLSLVKHIVMLHGGRIEVDSAPGGGTKFTVTFPGKLTRN
jgi:two-component system phosphate regulon sensor histidine kinase PhoR